LDADPRCTVGRTSITLTPQPEIQFESYFAIPESGGTTESTTPTQHTVLTVQVETPEDVLEGGSRQQQNETSGTGSKDSIFTTGSQGTASAQRHPKNVSELFSGPSQLSSESTSATAAEDAAHHEKSFGTNLTTGKREYLSQYSHTQGNATETVDDKTESVASRSTQYYPVPSDSSPSTLSANSSLSGDFSSPGGSDSTVATIDLDDGDIY
jgi:hypothetical protein